MIAVTGATGHLGRLVVSTLLSKGVDPETIVAAVRRPAAAADFAEQGVTVREANYTEPDTLSAALEDVDRLLLISSNEVGRRIDQHRNVIGAAVSAGADLIAYTSAPKADTTPMKLAADHKATEEMIRASGLSFVLLRNSWYTENYTDQLPQYLKNGIILGAAGDGRISAAPRSDYAAAAAAVLTAEGHEGAVYELGGDDAFTMNDLAEEITRQSDVQIAYRNLPPDDYAEALANFGMPEAAAAIYADADAAVSRGALYVDSGDLSRLVGRPTTPLKNAVAGALADLTSA